MTPLVCKIMNKLGAYIVGIAMLSSFCACDAEVRNETKQGVEEAAEDADAAVKEAARGTKEAAKDAAAEIKEEIHRETSDTTDVQ